MLASVDVSVVPWVASLTSPMISDSISSMIVLLDSVAVSVTFEDVVVVVGAVVTVPSLIASEVQALRKVAPMHVTAARTPAIMFFLIIPYSNTACAAIFIDFIDVKTQYTSASQAFGTSSQSYFAPI